MYLKDSVMWFLIWVVFPVVTYIAAVAGMYTAYTSVGWLVASVLYILNTWLMLWLLDSLGRINTADLSHESLLERYIKPLQYALPGQKADRARLRLAEEKLTRFVRDFGDVYPIYLGRYSEIEIFPSRVLATGDYGEYIQLYFGPKWYAWADLVLLLLWPVSIPVALVSLHAYGLVQQFRRA